MLRTLVVLLLVANGLFFAWTQGWLDRVVGPARAEREPQRLAAQVRPELVQILPPGGAASAASAAASGSPAAASGVAAAASTPMAAASPASSPGVGLAAAGSSPPASAAPTSTTVASRPASLASPASSPAAPPAGRAAAPSLPTASAAGKGPASAPPVTAAASASPGSCLEAGPFAPTELAAAEAALRPTLAAGGWTQRRVQGGGEWMIYMGPYPDREFLERKKGELSRIRGGVPQEEVSAPPELARGLSLGRFPSPAAANAKLADYRLRGIRTARVVQSSSGQPQVYLRVAQAEPAVAAALGSIKLPPGARGFGACPR